MTGIMVNKLKWVFKIASIPTISNIIPSQHSEFNRCDWYWYGPIKDVI